MSANNWFWILAVIFAIFGIGGWWVPEPHRPRYLHGGVLFLFILILILGYRTFGQPIQ